MVNINSSLNTSLKALGGNGFYLNSIVLKILTAIIIFFIGFIIGKVAENILLRLFDEMELNKHLTKLFKAKLSYSKIISRFVAYIAFIISIIWALNVIGITRLIIVIIVAVVAVILVLFVIFGINDLVANIFAGILVRLRTDIKIGDHIKASNIEGHIIDMDWQHIRLETGKEESVFIPYTALLKARLKKKK